MAEYRVRDPQTGRTVVLRGESPPTEAELTDIFATLAPQQPDAKPEAPLAQPAAATAGMLPASAPRVPIDLKNVKLTRENFRQVLEEAGRLDRRDKAASAAFLPAAGGLVGGAFGGIPAALAGGAAGEAARQAALRSLGEPGAPETPGGQLMSMAKEGAVQGALQGGGQLVAGVASKSARFLMNRAANVSDRLAREFPELSQTLIDHAITMTQGGYQRAQRLLGGFKAQANAALRTAERKGLGVDIELTPEIAESLKAAAIEKAMKTGTAKAGAGPLKAATQRLDARTKVLINTVDSAVARKAPMRLTPTEADMLKSHLQRESKNAVYAARLNPNGSPAIATAAAEKAEFASQLNGLLDDIADGYMAANSKAREMIGATRAVRSAVRPGKNLYMAMVRPTTGMVAGGVIGGSQGDATTGALLGAAAGTPAGMSSIAVLLGNPAVRQVLGQLPRGVYESVMASLRTPESAPAQTGR